MELTRGPKIQLVIQNKHLEMQNTVQAKMSENNKQKKSTYTWNLRFFMFAIKNERAKNLYAVVYGYERVCL